MLYSMPLTVLTMQLPAGELACHVSAGKDPKDPELLK
jgi:hypothetical protein